MLKEKPIPFVIAIIIAFLWLPAALTGQDEGLFSDTNPSFQSNKAETAQQIPVQLAQMLPTDIILELTDHVSASVPLWGVRMEGASMIGLYFKRLFIPGGDSLLIFGSPGSEPLWIFTAKQTDRARPTATPLLDGDSLSIEYRRHPQTRINPEIQLEAIAYGGEDTKALLQGTVGTESTTSCMVNVNCSPEGVRWQDEKRSIVRISLKKGSLVQLITGTLVNTTAGDARPYLLTSDNAMIGVSAQDLQQSVFYFDYELPGCDTIGMPSFFKTLTGATLVAAGGISCNLGSDYYLMRLNQYIPSSYNPYFLGWDRSGAVVDSGVSLHFSGGLVKQIASFNTLLGQGQYGGNTPNTHWNASWASTANGTSTTRPGGEGAPLLDRFGRIIGIFTGGYASCSQPQNGSLFGKFSIAWDQYAAVPTTRLKEWLDPSLTGTWTLDGVYPTIFPPEARLSFSDSAIITGDTIWFWDQSLGNPSQWEWQFPGGQPSSWIGQHPPGVVYSSPGVHDVMLQVTNSYGTDSLTLNTRIFVYPVSDTIKTSIDTFLSCADTLLIPITVENFYFVKQADLVLSLDTLNMQYLGMHYLHPSLQTLNPQIYVSGTDLWIRFSAAIPFQLGDDTLAILRVLPLNGSIPLIWNTFQNWKCKYYDVNQQAYPAVFQDGMVQVVPCASLGGTLRYHQSHYGLASSILEVTRPYGDRQDYLTAADGSFTTSAFLPDTIQILPHTLLPWGGVNATDALLILKHFARIDTLNGLILAAADVNGNGAVNAADALMAAQRFAGIITQFPVSDWIFRDTTLVAAPGQNNLILEGICRGDVNASRPSSLMNAVFPKPAVHELPLQNSKILFPGSPKP